jgi:predicted acetyltransferase
MVLNFRNAEASDIDQIAMIRHESFRRATEGARWTDGSGRVVSHHNEILGIGQVYRTQQMFGGKPVSSCAITSIAVSVPARNQGVASRLVADMLSEQRESGAAFASLYPSSPAVYRRSGFEFVATRTIHKAPSQRERPSPANADLSVEWSTWNDDLLSEVSDCYERYVSSHNGPFKRNPWWWNRYILDKATQSAEAATPYCIRVFERDTLAAYAIYSQTEVTGRTPFEFVNVVHDLGWTTGSAAQSLASSIRSHWPYQQAVVWSGPPTDSFAIALGADLGEVESTYPLMGRLVNVSRALEKRGYPVHCDSSLTLGVTDPILPQNQCNYHLQVLSGRCEVARARSADVEIDVGALSAIFAGWLSETEAFRLGRISYASVKHVGKLDAIFSSSAPWMPEFF